MSTKGRHAQTTTPQLVQGFTPVRYRPVPTHVHGLQTLQMPLDGTWHINPAPKDGFRRTHLTAPEWGTVMMPGQWRQQGYDVPQDREVAMAREFALPAEWNGYRLFLRFDSIHAGTSYWLNGRPLGYGENLFTPIEWEITDFVETGRANRLDLLMKVDTISEQLSKASFYAFHSLGGIDRSVRIYALPEISIKHLRVRGDLDANYDDGLIHLEIETENATGQPMEGVSVRLRLFSPEGEETPHSVTRVDFGTVDPGVTARSITSTVTKPPQWNAEKPGCHKLTVELCCRDTVMETAICTIGFRTVEIKGRQLYINGRRVKLAGVCRHEIDPLTGRANTMHHAEEDLRLVKAANLNLVRTSHYPPPIELVEAADRLGVYLEVEAPICWMPSVDDMSSLREVLTPTSAMVDYYYSHPSVILWSLANESPCNDVFTVSDRMVKALDDSRPTTFETEGYDAYEKPENNTCDIASKHYQPMPYDRVAPDASRPLFLGEYVFPICHEETDVRINPGLRELWGHGHADPSSAWAKKRDLIYDGYCDESYENHMRPSAKAGFWSHIVASEQLIGGAIWAWQDDAFHFADGSRAGFAWHHGFWGLIDAWRRVRPEWELARYIFSPVWFPRRTVAFSPGQQSVTLPVENRYSFTDLSELVFSWELGEEKGIVHASGAPGCTAEISLPVSVAARAGDAIRLRVAHGTGAAVNDLLIHLGEQKTEPLPQPTAGPPNYTEDANSLFIEGNGFAFVIDRKRATLQPTDPRHNSVVRSFPEIHLTRFDFGDLAKNKLPYAVLPDAASHKVVSFSARDTGTALEIIVRDSYQEELLRGHTTWLIDREGTSTVEYDYTYSGEDDFEAREIGLRLLVDRKCDTLRWRRWSEWDIFPADSICRAEGTTRIWRPGTAGADPEGVRPTWPWGQDQTELGTADFRGVKFCIYQASLSSLTGAAVIVRANADQHVRCCLAGASTCTYVDDGILMHILTECEIGPMVLKKGDRITGTFSISLNETRE